MHIREALKLARELGAFNAAQAAYSLGMPLDKAQEFGKIHTQRLIEGS